MIVRKLVAVVATAPLVLLSACSDSPSTTADPETTASSQADTSSGEGDTETASGGSLSQASFAQAISAAQLEAETAHVSMSMDAGGQTVSLDGDMQAGESVEDTAVHMTMSMSGQQLEMILVDGVMYMNMGAMTQGKYVKLDLSDPDSALGGQFDQILANIDPTKSIEAMQDAVTKFEEAGTETIDGVETTRYKVKVNTAKLYKAMDMTGLAGQAGMPQSIDYVMYVDDDDLLRRMEMDLGAVTMDMDFTQWGEPVDISAPPANQVLKGNPFGAAG